MTIESHFYKGMLSNGTNLGLWCNIARPHQKTEYNIPITHNGLYTMSAFHWEARMRQGLYDRLAAQKKSKQDYVERDGELIRHHLLPLCACARRKNNSCGNIRVLLWASVIKSLFESQNSNLPVLQSDRCTYKICRYIGGRPPPTSSRKHPISGRGDMPEPFYPRQMFVEQVSSGSLLRLRYDWLESQGSKFRWRDEAVQNGVAKRETVHTYFWCPKTKLSWNMGNFSPERDASACLGQL